MKDYYKILGLTKNCDNKEIKIAYRKKAIFWHPDKNSSLEANDRFIEVKEAYEILSDFQKRKTYDNLFQNTEQKTKNQEKEHEFYKWTEEAVKEAKSDLNLPIQKFIKKVNRAVDTVQYGCGMFFLIYLWICFGPFILLGFVYQLVVNFEKLKPSILGFVIGIPLLLISIIITLKGWKFIKLMNKYHDYNN